MNRLLTLFVIVFISLTTFAQTGLNWSDISNTQNLPAGVNLFAGERATPLPKSWYLEVDLNRPDIVVRPYIGSPRGLSSFTTTVGAYAAINGGYFSGSTSVSAVVYPQEVRAQNLATLNRNGTIHPVTRSFFGITSDKSISIDWIYHFNSEVSGIYSFDQPTQNAPEVVAPVAIALPGK